MISAAAYHEYLLDYDRRLAADLWPYGIHYCGTDMHKVRHEFAAASTASRALRWAGVRMWPPAVRLPTAVFSLRLSPVRVSTLSRKEVIDDVEGLLRAAGPLERAALCCINMDDKTPDENVRAIFETAARYRRYGA
jgi:hypothetical protein